MKPEKQILIHDLLDGQREARRAATLMAGSRTLRARRWRRRVFQTCAVFAFFGVTSIALQRLLAPAPSETAVAAVSSTAVPEKKADPIESLTDEQLLALFPDTPVCLATLESGQKRLIFLRPEDAQKFVGRL